MNASSDDYKQYINKQAQQIATAVSALTLTIDDHATALDLPALYEVVLWCDEVRNTLALVKQVAEAAMVSQVPKDTRVSHWVASDGQAFRTEVKYRAARTAVQRDDLYKAVKQTARVVDQATGEVALNHEQLVTTLEKTFRFEPRWTEIKALGIDPDEYCVAKYEPQLVTTPEQQQEEAQ